MLKYLRNISNIFKLSNTKVLGRWSSCNYNNLKKTNIIEFNLNSSNDYSLSNLINIDYKTINNKKIKH